jgi:hypothetical protein
MDATGTSEVETGETLCQSVVELGHLKSPPFPTTYLNSSRRCANMFLLANFLTRFLISMFI